MKITMLLTNQIAVMFVMIAFGFLAAKCKVMNREDCRGLSTMALYVIIPCVLVNSFQVPFTGETVYGLLLAFAASFLVNLGYVLLTKLLSRFFPMSAVEKASLIYPNAGNLIVPMVGAVLGENMILYCSGFMIMQNLFIWTHGKLMISGETRPSVRNIFGNSTMISILLGIFLAVTRLPLPGLLQSAIGSVGKALAPVCMFVTGVTIGTMPLKKVFLAKRAYEISFLRLVIYPLLVLLLFLVTDAAKILPNADQILLVVFLASAAPSASNIVQFAQYYHNDEQMAGLINVLSTLLCIVTMPLLVYLFQAMV